MTLCRKCGKEIPDGEELCEDCKNEESQMDEAYLEELMQSMRWRRNRQKKLLMEKRM